MVYNDFSFSLADDDRQERSIRKSGDGAGRRFSGIAIHAGDADADQA
jgi:hypothetical protein